MTALRVHLVEDDAAVADSLVTLLDSWGVAVEAFGDGESFLDAPHPADIACVLLDVRLPGQDGLAVLEALRARGVRTPVIVLTGHGDIAMAVRALQLGACDFVEKPFDDADLVARIHRAAEGRPRGAGAFERLTPREVEVMREVVAGNANKVIAHNLGMSPKTVEIHRARVMEKTGARSLPHLVRMAIDAGIATD